MMSACQPKTEVTQQPLNELQVKGQLVFKQHCVSCHSTIPNSIVVGPSLFGIATSAADRVSGQSAKDYIENSIINPESYIVDGFKNLMVTTFSETLSEV